MKFTSAIRCLEKLTQVPLAYMRLNNDDKFYYEISTGSNKMKFHGAQRRILMMFIRLINGIWSLLQMYGGYFFKWRVQEWLLNNGMWKV